MIICGDALTELRKLPDESVNCCVTSPPYWGLRDYGIPGQLGLEKTPDEYVARMVEVFREVRRVLAKDGTLWLNLGDSYAAGAGGRGDTGNIISGHQTRTQSVGNGRIKRELGIGLKPKDLVGIPWRVAFALQADGWWLRQDIIWAKPNPMPESVEDRPTRSHEYIFLLSKEEQYYYDHRAIIEPGTSGPSDIKKMIESKERLGGKHKHLVDPFSKASSTTNIGKKRGVGGILVDKQLQTESPFYRKPAGWNSGPGSHRDLVGRYREDKQRGHRPTPCRIQ